VEYPWDGKVHFLIKKGNVLFFFQFLNTFLLQVKSYNAVNLFDLVSWLKCLWRKQMKSFPNQGCLKLLIVVLLGAYTVVCHSKAGNPILPPIRRPDVEMWRSHIQ